MMKFDPALRTSYKADPSLLHVSWNQDCSCVSVGTRSGYSIINCDPFGRVYGKSEPRMLRRTGGRLQGVWGLRDGRWKNRSVSVCSMGLRETAEGASRGCG